MNSGLLLPLHLGWWNFQHFNPPQVEPSYPDVIEYLGAKLIGWDAGISLTGAIDRSRLEGIPLFRRAVDVLRTCEELRRANAFDETIKAKLRRPGDEFSLFRDDHGKWRFRPAAYDPHTASCSEPWSLSWTTRNPFSEQPVRFRLEALMSTGSYDDANNIVGEGFWGFTEDDGTAMGRTPLAIRRACMMLVIRMLPVMGNAEDAAEAKNAWRIIEEKTRDQSYKLDKPGTTSTITGDPEIDQILVRYSKPMGLGAA